MDAIKTSGLILLSLAAALSCHHVPAWQELLPPDLLARESTTRPGTGSSRIPLFAYLCNACISFTTPCGREKLQTDWFLSYAKGETSAEA